MLQITIPAVKETEYWDEAQEKFVIVPGAEGLTLDMEHSLVSLSKWESKWCKAFLSKEPKTEEQSMDYFKCMTLTPNVDPEVYKRLTKKHIDEINNYIQAPMTATYISDDKNGKGGRETVTAELIYYWMIALQIPFECQFWHLNRLLTLVRVCNVKQAPPKKMSQKQLTSRNAALNAARRKKLGTSG